MYSEIVHEHVSRPRNVGPLAGATHQGTAGVPGDGPYMILWFEVADGRILRAAYKTYGCIAARGAQRNTYTNDGDGQRRSHTERTVSLTTMIWDGDDYLGEY